MADAKPRILQDNRDMVLSMLVLMLICAAFAGLIGQCSFGSAQKEGEIPSFDAAASLRGDARTMAFPIREPAIPEGWVTNSGRQENLAGAPASHVGYVTPARTFVELVQSSAPVSAFRDLPAGPRPTQSVIPVHGREWTTFTGDDARPVWVTDLDGTRVGLVGTASRSDFETLAIAVQDAAPLPRG